MKLLPTPSCMERHRYKGSRRERRVCRVVRDQRLDPNPDWRIGGESFGIKVELGQATLRASLPVVTQRQNMRTLLYLLRLEEDKDACISRVPN